MLSPLDAVRERLLRAGVAPRHAHRFVNELRDHFSDIVDEEKAAGLALYAAEARAMARLGSVEALAQAMTDRVQFRAWSVKAPLMIYIFGPPIVLALCFVGSSFIIVVACKIYRSAAGGLFTLPPSFEILAQGLGLLTAFVIPVLLGWGLVLLAIRQRAKWRWPASGIVAIAIMGAVAQLTITLPTSTGGHGEIGIDSVLIPPFSNIGSAITHALANLLIVFIPYFIAERSDRIPI